MRPFCEVIGRPIAHSLSPVLARAAFSELDLAWDYHKTEVTPEELPRWFEQYSDLRRGVAVTMPHKQRIIPLLDAVDPLAQALNTVNTVVFSHRVATGFNTDVYGITEAIKRIGKYRPGRVVILGGRATASSALAAVGELGFTTITIVARTHYGPGTVGHSSQNLGLSFTAIPWTDLVAARRELAAADLIISTVPARVADELVPTVDLNPASTVLDVVYDPWPSALVQHAYHSKATVVPGQEMLASQAQLQLQLFTGKTVAIDTLRTALELV